MVVDNEQDTKGHQARPMVPWENMVILRLYAQSSTASRRTYTERFDALIKSAIDSRAHMEAESEDEDGDEEEEGGSSSAPGPRTLQETVRAQPHPEPPSRSRKKGGKTTIRLADLFLYPRAPRGYDGLSPAEKQVFEASDDGDRLRRLRFIWKMGEVQYNNEQRLTETLQPDGRREA
ncbi:hypothetical protein GSI_10427 [Ganoderma sinense ZZ0214-1]|uniref:Uncharacterized protein n=1 Tax=Ganoderma sinense ZZ0214-1 TaxID=1077348 RepID=A0A2G8S0H9_9APHY|nr:hypothetical protein GSI_10427 [Ganoderma sinense ZZ0214-1]